MVGASFVGGVDLAVQDRLELVGKGVVTTDQTVAAGGKTVVGDNRRNRGEQADGGGNQCFGDAGGYGGQSRLLHLGQAAEGVHDAPDGAEQADVRAGRADG